MVPQGMLVSKMQNILSYEVLVIEKKLVLGKKRKKLILCKSRSFCKVLRCDVYRWLTWPRQAQERPEMLS